MKKYLLIILIVLISSSLFPFNVLGSYSDAEVTILMMDGIGPRITGLGGVFTSIADDISTLTVNPAGLSLLEHREISAGYSFYPLGLNLINIGIGIPLKMKKLQIGTLGLGLTILVMEKFEELDAIGNTIGERLNSFELVATAGYSINPFKLLKIDQNLNIGFNAKFVHTSVITDRKFAIAFDFGILYKMKFFGFDGEKWGLLEDSLEFGTAFNNLGISKVFGTEIKMPWDLKAGVSYRGIDTRRHRLRVACDLTVPNDSRIAVGFGVEYTIFKMISMRVGVNVLGKENDLVSFGLGGDFKIGKVHLRADYSIKPILNIGIMHSASVSIIF